MSSYIKGTIRTALQEIENHANRFTNSKKVEIRQFAEDILIRIDNMRAAWKNMLDKSVNQVDSRIQKRLQELDITVKKLENSSIRIQLAANTIAGVVPFFRNPPQVATIEPRLIDINSTPDSQGNVSIRITGNFPTVGQNHVTIRWIVNGQRFAPYHSTLVELGFQAHESLFARPQVGSIAQTVTHIKYTEARAFLSPIDYVFRIAIGTLPSSGRGQQKKTPSPSIPMSPSQSRNGALDSPILHGSQQDWNEIYTMWPEADYNVRDLIDSDTDRPVIINGALIYQGRYGRFSPLQNIDISDFSLRGCLTNHHLLNLQVCDSNGDLIDLQHCPPSHTAHIQDINHTLFYNDLVLSHSCNSRTVFTKKTYVNNCGKMCTRDSYHVEKSTTLKLWDLNFQQELWNFSFPASKTFSEEIFRFESVNLSSQNAIIFHLRRTGKGYSERLVIVSPNDGSILHEIDMGTFQKGYGAFCHEDDELYLVKNGRLQKWNMQSYTLEAEIPTSKNIPYLHLKRLDTNKVLCCYVTNGPLNEVALQIFDFDQGECIYEVQVKKDRLVFYHDLVVEGNTLAQALIVQRRGKRGDYFILDLDNYTEYPLPLNWRVNRFSLFAQDNLLLSGVNVNKRLSVHVFDLNTLELIRTIETDIPFSNSFDLNIEEGTVTIFDPSKSKKHLQGNVLELSGQ